MEHNSKRGSWGSNLGFILAAAGSAVGLGNIWKFPNKVGENGGSAFILIYLAIVVLIGFTAMMAEFTIGRHTQKNAVGAFKQLNPKFKFVGGLGILVGFIILSYYSVVGGWVLKYVVTYLTGANFGGDYSKYFVDFVSNPIAPLIWHFLFMALTVWIVSRDISAGIEKTSKFLMPVLFILIIVIAIRSCTLPGAGAGLEYLLKPDFSKVTSATFVAALGQAFFSLSLGMGIMCTYASYLKKEDNLAKSALTICGLDTLAAILAGFAIMPAVFAMGMDPGSGGGWAFTTLPAVFNAMPAGAFFGLLFFLLLFFAALTSSMSILTGTVAYVVEEFKWSRVKASVILGTIMAVIGIGYSLSQGAVDIQVPWLDFSGVTYTSLGNFMEYLTDNLLMPICSLLYCIFVGWIWGPKNAIKEVEQNNRFKFYGAGVWTFAVKFIAPAAILIILFSSLKLF